MGEVIFQNAGLYLPDGHVEAGALRVVDGVIDRVIRGGAAAGPDTLYAASPAAGAADTPAGPEQSSGTVDLAGGVVLPGLVDTHFHLTSLALKKMRCDLSKTTSAGEVVETLRQYAADYDGDAVAGVEWDENNWSDARYPTRQQLDAVDAKRPVLARRICGHVGVANSALLAMLPSDRGLADRESGLLREHVLWEANGLVAPPLDTLSEWIESGIAELHRLGVTGIHDIVESTRFEPYAEGIRRSRRPLRIDALVHVHPSQLGHFEDMSAGMDPAYFRIAGVKTFLDGSLGGETAALTQPYAGSTGTGTLLVTDDDLESITRGAYERDRMCAIHAIGDRAINQALDAIERFPADCGRFRIEHCELVGPEQIRRLYGCRPILAMQPNFVGNWGGPGGLYEQRLGKERMRFLNPLAHLRTAGLDLIFGSDGMPPGPLHGIHSAVNHWSAAERLSVHDAIDGYTHAANSVGRHARNAGDIAEGQLADFTVLDGDPLEGDISDLRVTHTIIAGEVVFEARSGADLA